MHLPTSLTLNCFEKKSSVSFSGEVGVTLYPRKAKIKFAWQLLVQNLVYHICKKQEEPVVSQPTSSHHVSVTLILMLSPLPHACLEFPMRMFASESCLRFSLPMLVSHPGFDYLNRRRMQAVKLLIAWFTVVTLFSFRPRYSPRHVFKHLQPAGYPITLEP
jgi:hypothetical protein